MSDINWTCMMLRNVNLWDSCTSDRCLVFQSGSQKPALQINKIEHCAEIPPRLRRTLQINNKEHCAENSATMKANFGDKYERALCRNPAMTKTNFADK